MKKDFHQFIHEANFNSILPWKKKNPNEYWFYINDSDDTPMIYDVSFIKKEETPKNINKRIEISFTIDLGPGTYKITSLSDTGNQYRVLSTVMSIILDFMKNHPNENEYFFRSVGASRTKVYKRLINKFLSNDKWNIDQIKINGSTTEFTISSKIF